MNILNWVLYGNVKGEPTSKGKSSTEYNDFIKKVFAKKSKWGEEEKYDDGQGREYDILDEELN